MAEDPHPLSQKSALLDLLAVFFIFASEIRRFEKY